MMDKSSSNLDENTVPKNYHIDIQSLTVSNSDINDSDWIPIPTHCALTHLISSCYRHINFKDRRGKHLACFIFVFLLVGVIAGTTVGLLLKSNSQDPDKQEDACDSSPCLHGGTCISFDIGYICNCSAAGLTAYKCPVKYSCQKGLKAYIGTCYYFSNSSSSWNVAKSTCKSLDSMLAEPKDMIAINFLKSNAKMFQETFWLGGSDLAAEGVWVWTTSGQGFTVTDWHTSTIHEPNNENGTEHCLNMNKHLDYEWNDDNCWNENRFACEKPLEYVW